MPVNNQERYRKTSLLSAYRKKVIALGTTAVLSLSAIVGLPVVANADVTGPVFVSATTTSGGDVIILTYDETLFDPAPALFAPGQFVVSSGTSRVIESIAIDGATVRLTMDANNDIDCGEEVITVSYTNTLNPLQDPTGNDADNLVDASVSNVVPNCEGGGGGGGGGDTTPPTVSITSDRAGQTITVSDRNVTFTFTFSENVNNFGVGDIVVTGGTPDTFTVVTSDVYTLLVVADAESIIPITVDVAADVAEDGANNGNTIATQLVQEVDTRTGGGGGGGGDPDIIPPTVSITSNRDGQTLTVSDRNATFTFTFSENVTGFTADDIDITGGTKGTFTPVSGTIYTLVVLSDEDSTTPITVDVAAEVAQDGASNGNTIAVQLIQQVDTIYPTVSITSDRQGQTADGDVTFTFTFDEDIFGFDIGDIDITGGTKGAFTQTGDRTFTLVVSPSANTDTSIRVNVGSTVSGDAAGNGNAAATEFVQLVDTTVPTVSITSNRQGETARGDVVFTITFDRPITGFHGTEFVVTGGTRLSLTGTNPGTFYLATVRPDASTTTSIRVNIAAGVVQDADGKLNTAATELEQLVDTLVTVSITSDRQGQAANGDVTFTFTFDEDVSGFDATDIDISSGTKGTFTEVSPDVYTLVVSPDANTDTSIRVNVASGAAQDDFGNENVPAIEFEQLVDTIDPTVSITSDRVGATNGDDVTFIFIFDEDVTEFDQSDIEITGGTKGTFSGGGTTYTLVVSPLYNTDTSIRVNVAADAADDLAGNGNVAATEYVQLVDTIDSTDPTVSITSDRQGQAANGDVTFTFTFDEDVSGFDATDIDISSGTKGTFTEVSPDVYTLVVSPDANTDTSIRVNVAADAADDLAGNGNVAATEFVQLVDTIDPTVSGSATVNRTAPTTTVATYTSEGGVTWSLSGANAGLFNIVGGVVTFKTASVAGTYNIVVEATDASNNKGTLNVTVIVAAAPDTTPPTVSGSATVNRTAPTTTVATYTSEGGVTWSLSGANAGLFNIVGGVVTFKTASVAGTYNIVVEATDASNNKGTLNVTVIVAAAPSDGGAITAPTPVPPTATEKKAVVPGFAANSTKLTKKMKQEIRELLEANPTLNNVVCKGFTSAPATAQDRVLARQRGKAACDFIKTIRPDAQVTIRSGSHTNEPGSQIRRVTISLS